MAATPGSARLTGPGPAREQLPAGPLIPVASCDATASGAEDAQVWLSRDGAELALCAHHYRKLGLALIAAGWYVTRDNRKLP